MGDMGKERERKHRNKADWLALVTTPALREVDQFDTHVLKLFPPASRRHEISHVARDLCLDIGHRDRFTKVIFDHLLQRSEVKPSTLSGVGDIIFLELTDESQDRAGEVMRSVTTTRKVPAHKVAIHD
jgi:hypothetical protein